MKLSILKYILIALITLSACHKVQDDLKAQNDQPSVSLTGVTLPDGTYLSYPKDARPGDTITIAGRLNLSKGAVIRLGHQDAVIVDSENFIVNYPPTGANYSMEKARFVVTAEMGSGPQPLIVTYGAYRVQAPDIYIIAATTGGTAPDTTLQVTNVFDGTGTGMDEYMARYRSTSTYIDVALAMTNDGTVYFASRRDIYRIRNNSLEWLLKQEDSLVIEGKKYPLTQLMGMTPDLNNTVLYFSFYSTVTAADNYNRIYWLLKKNLSSGAITVLNKTEVEYDGPLPTGQTRPAGNHYGGAPVSQMPLYPTQLKADAKGRLLFLNFNLHDNQRSVEYYGRMDPSNNNIVTPLYERKTSLAGVFKCEFNIGFTPDGLAAYVSHEQNEVWPRSSGITVIDLETLEPVHYVDAKVNITYASFDPNPERRMKLKSSYIYFTSNGMLPGDQLPISKTELLFVNGYSIASFNPELAYLYSYAGIEAGCAPTGSSDAVKLPEQNQKTGQAKYVNFTSHPDYGGRVRFIGQDVTGAIYYLRGAQNITLVVGGVKRYYLPPTIYKISKR